MLSVLQPVGPSRPTRLLYLEARNQTPDQMTPVLESSPDLLDFKIWGG